MENNEHVISCQETESLIDIFLVHLTKEEWLPNQVFNIIPLQIPVKLSSKVIGSLLWAHLLLVVEFHLVLVLQLLEDVILNSFFLDLVDEHVDGLEDTHVFILALICKADIELEHVK